VIALPSWPMRKKALLELLSGEVCPICECAKRPHVWTCKHCFNRVSQAPEHRTLGDECDRHLVAADAFLTVAGQAWERGKI